GYKREGVSIHIFKTGEHSTPKGSLRRMMKMNPELTPFLISGIDIFCDEYNLASPANQLIFFAARLRSYKRKDRIAVRRGHRYPATTAFKAGISNQAESKLVHKKSQALILIPNENREEENTQVWGLAVQAYSGSIPPGS